MLNKEAVRTHMDEMKVKGTQLVGKVKEIMEEGNARRVTIRKEGRTLLELPLTVGVGGATAAVFLMPTLAAVGALAALVTDVDVIVERVAQDVTEVPVEDVE
jgi:endonuclease III